MEQAADALCQHHATRHASGGFQRTTEETAAGRCRCLLLRGIALLWKVLLRGTEVLLWRLRTERRASWFTPATARWRRALGRCRLWITGSAAKDTRQKATAARRWSRGRLGLGLLQFGLQLLDLPGQLLVLLIEALDCCLLHQNRLGHEISCRRLARQVFLDPRLGLSVARG
ncbi:hypothetical protein D9M71_694070 [compost metagenome]